MTSEKGVPRVKVYSEFGEFESVVAGPKRLGVAQSELGDPRAVQAKAVFEVATDSQGRILVLDPRRKSVRIFNRIAKDINEANQENVSRIDTSQAVFNPTDRAETDQAVTIPSTESEQGVSDDKS
ncbi:MAG: hypothetical protein P8L85_12375 [Rubripirellula sp.]|nr:hypothetical protein [Rubripirellula sp.]